MKECPKLTSFGVPEIFSDHASGGDRDVLPVIKGDQEKFSQHQRRDRDFIRNKHDKQFTQKGLRTFLHVLGGFYSPLCFPILVKPPNVEGYRVLLCRVTEGDKVFSGF